MRILAAMGKKPLTRDSQFIVGEEKILNIVLGILFLALFAYGIYDAAGRNFVKIDPQSYVFALAVIPSILFFRKATSGKIYIRINMKGIYENERLVTTWSNFIRAALVQKKDKKMFDIRDYFQLLLEYRKDGSLQILQRKIHLTNTQNQSEEDVMAAVKFFWTEYKKDHGAPMSGQIQR